MNKFTQVVVVLCISMLSIFKTHAQVKTLENNKIPMDPIVGTGVTINSSTSLTGGASNTSNVVNGDLSDFSTIDLTLSLLGGGVGLTVQDAKQYYPAGNVVGFVVAPGAGILSASALSNISIKTFRDGVLQETATVSGGLLNASVLGGSIGKQVLSFTTTKDFDQVQLFYSGGIVGLFNSLNVYYAFEGPAATTNIDCSTKWVNGGSGTYNVSKGLYSTGLAICASGVSNEANVVNASTTDYASMDVLLAIALGSCNSYIEVTSPTTVPAGSEAGFVVSDGNSLINLSLLSAVTIETYNGSIKQESISGGSSLVKLGLLGNTNTYELGFKTTKAFNKIRIVSTSGLVSVLGSLRVHYAYSKLDSDNDGVSDCLDKCAGGNDLLDTDGDGIPDSCDANTINVAVSKTSSNNGAPVPQGTQVTYTIKATRASGSAAATGLEITDLLPSGVTYVSHSAESGTTYDQTTGKWYIGSLLGGDKLVATLTITVTAKDEGVIFNTATITAKDGNSNTGKESETVCISVPVKLCSNESLTLTAPTTLTSYQWKKDGVNIPGATTNKITVTEAGSYTLDGTLTGNCPTGNCCPIIVELLPIPVLAVTPQPTKGNCTGSTITLGVTGTNTATYAWAGPNGFTSTSANPTVTTSATSVHAGVYTITGTSSLGCTATATVQVNVNPVPTATANAPLQVCLNGTANLSVSSNPAGANYSWSGPAGFTSTVATPTIASVTNANVGTYSVTVTDINGCTATTTTSISLYTAPIIAITPTALAVCEQSPITLTASGASTYSWTGPNGFTSTSANPTVTASASMTQHAGVYTVTGVSGNNCSATATVNVMVNPKPMVTATTVVAVNCSGVPLTLKATTDGTTPTYSWSGPNSFTSTAASPVVSANATAAMSGTYTVTVTDSKGCIGTASVAVTVNPAPTTTITGGPTITVCSDSPIAFTLGGKQTGETYAWSGPNSFTSTVAEPTVTAAATAANQGVYTVVVTSTLGCNQTATVSVTVNATPAGATSNVSVCAGTPTTLTATGGSTYSWDTGETTASISVSPTLSTTYRVTKTSAQGCSIVDVFNVTVKAAPTLAGAVSICSDAGTPATSTDDTYTFTLNPSGGSGTTYTVSGSGITTSTAQNYGAPSTSFGPFLISGGAKTITITDANGCSLNNVTITPPATCSSCPQVCVPITITKVR
ncbi:hypothetical protein [Flectobacillus roseus]|uniref:hypothetical protein n=1 Tax=Flectobacillus roseus TaxID=502259 RepID=UPI0024B6ECC9|nr:hypothetical protein [Flectobacillus roseus]MDI9868239.1 hypothetical protein [Flectobacillus roseus]